MLYFFNIVRQPKSSLCKNYISWKPIPNISSCSQPVVLESPEVTGVDEMQMFTWVPGLKTMKPAMSLITKKVWAVSLSVPTTLSS